MPWRLRFGQNRKRSAGVSAFRPVYGSNVQKPFPFEPPVRIEPAAETHAPIGQEGWLDKLPKIGECEGEASATNQSARSSPGIFVPSPVLIMTRPVKSALTVKLLPHCESRSSMSRMPSAQPCCRSTSSAKQEQDLRNKHLRPARTDSRRR